MQRKNEFILKINNDDYVVSNESLILLKNINNKTNLFIHSEDYLKLTNDVKNKFILENISS